MPRFWSDYLMGHRTMGSPAGSVGSFDLLHRPCAEGRNTIPVSITSTHLRRVLRAMLSDRRNHNPACVLLGMSTLLPSSFSRSDALVRLAPQSLSVFRLSTMSGHNAGCGC